MIDRPFGDAARMLRSPDLHLGGIETEIFRSKLPFEHVVDRPDRGMLVCVRKGDFDLDVRGSKRGLVDCPQGTVVGFEDGRPHRWRAKASGSGGEIELFISSIPRRQGVLQRLADGVIIVPRDAEPYSTILARAVDIHASESENPDRGDDEAVIRRCAEICLIELVRYARSMMARQPDMPAGLAHDEAMLRAWAAYFADPRRRWTLRALADAAGLGRTVFAERFRDIFGAPPLQTLTTLRLENAEAMLRGSQAPLIEIAFTVGYNSEAAFVRAFHRQYGVPPGRYRAQLRKAN